MNLLIAFVIGVALSVGGWTGYEKFNEPEETLGALSIITSAQLATGASNGYILSTNGSVNSWIANTGGSGGGGSSLWQYTASTDKLEPIRASTSQYARVTADSFQATSTATSSTFSLASITRLTNLTSNGFVKTGSGNGTLSIDTTTYESALTAGDGLTRTVNDFDCDTASGTVFGCLSAANWTTFNNKQDTITAGDALTLTGTDIDFDGGATPAGDLGGTWASPSVTDDSHAHTGTTLSGIDLSDDVNLTAGDALTLTGDDIDFDGGTAPSGELGGTWGAITIDDSIAVTNWNLTTPTLTSFFGTPCTGNDFLQDISDTGAFTCATAPGASGSGLGTTSPWLLGQLAYAVSSSSVSSVATGTLTETVSGLELSATRALVGGAAILALSSGFEISLSASTTNWNGFYDVPSTRITAGTGIDWSGNTLNGVYTAGDGLTLTGEDFDFDGGASPGGSLGGTWASPTIDDLFLLNNGDVGTGDFDFGGATTLEIVNGTGPTIDALGEFALDTTDNQLVIGTSTSAGAVLPTIQRIWSVTIPSTTPDFVSGGRIPTPQQRDGYTIKELHCWVDGGTSIVVNFSNGAGTADTETVTCNTFGTANDTWIGNNPTVAAAATSSIEIGTIVGTPDYLSISAFGVYTRE